MYTGTQTFRAMENNILTLGQQEEGKENQKLQLTKGNEIDKRTRKNCSMMWLKMSEGIKISLSCIPFSHFFFFW